MKNRRSGGAARRRQPACSSIRSGRSTSSHRRRCMKRCETWSCRRRGPPNCSCTPHRSMPNTLRNPQSVGKLLAAWAVRAGKTADLRQAIAARQGQVMAQLPSMILTAQLAAAANEPAASLEALRALAARMKNDTSRTTSELACHAAMPALEQRDARGGEGGPARARLLFQGARNARRSPSRWRRSC